MTRMCGVSRGGRARRALVRNVYLWLPILISDMIMNKYWSFLLQFSPFGWFNQIDNATSCFLEQWRGWGPGRGRVLPSMAQEGGGR